MFQIDFTENVKTFYFATGIPIAVLKNGRVVNSRPASVQTAENMAEEGSSISVGYRIQDYSSVQYVTSDYGEKFLIEVLDDTCTVAAGPVLIEPMRGGTLASVLQNKEIPIEMKPRFEQYYRDLKVISPQTYYYCGKLMSLLFASGNLKAMEQNRSTDHRVRLGREYFQNAYRNREKTFTHSPYFLEKRLIQQMKICDEEDALDTLHEINLQNRAVLADDPLRSLKDSIICSCTILTRAVIESGVSPDIAFTYSDTFIQRIEKMTALSEVENFEQEILRQSVRLIQKNSSKKYSAPVFNAMQYIINNLSQKLDLPEIAKHAYVHPNYLSSLFKKETGCSVTEFITRHRIEESTYFVAFTDFEIADISNYYHFCNQSYFCTLFKRYLSMSPNDYRKKHRK